MHNESLKDWSIIPLRLALGIAFLAHGAQKLFGAFAGPGIQGFAGFLGALGFPAASMFSVIVAVVEFFGGLLILIGLLTSYASLLIAIDMLVAIFAVHMKNGFFVGKGGIELALVLFFAAVSLALTGAGKLSLDKVLFKKKF